MNLENPATRDLLARRLSHEIAGHHWTRHSHEEAVATDFVRPVDGDRAHEVAREYVDCLHKSESDEFDNARHGRIVIQSEDWFDEHVGGDLRELTEEAFDALEGSEIRRLAKFVVIPQ